MKIRKYQEKDTKNLQYICSTLAVPPPKNDKQREILTFLYIDYFTKHESQNIFVAVNNDDDAIGYIVCSTNFKKYKQQMKKDYLHKVWKLSKPKWLLANLELSLNNRLSKEYSAFLHINILEQYQRLGVGNELMTTLIQHLQKLGINNLMVGTSLQNEKGMNFYKKFGFHEIMRKFGKCKLGIQFN